MAINFANTTCVFFFAQTEIDDNKYDSTNRINDLNSRLAQLMKDSSGGIKDLANIMIKENNLLRDAIAKPLSVYFDAYRSEDYLDGGEDYLTFNGE